MLVLAQPQRRQLVVFFAIGWVIIAWWLQVWTSCCLLIHG